MEYHLCRNNHNGRENEGEKTMSLSPYTKAQGIMSLIVGFITILGSFTGTMYFILGLRLAPLELRIGNLEKALSKFMNDPAFAVAIDETDRFHG